MSDCKLAGFTIKHGESYGLYGGGIGGNGCQAEIIGNIIEYNYSELGGAGIAECNGSIKQNDIHDNTGSSYSTGRRALQLLRNCRQQPYLRKYRREWRRYLRLRWNLKQQCYLFQFGYYGRRGSQGL